MKHHKKKTCCAFWHFPLTPATCTVSCVLQKQKMELDWNTELFTGINTVWPLVAEKEPMGEERRSGCSRVERVELWHCQESLQKLTGYRKTINSLPSSGSITWISFALIRHLNERVLLSK